MKPSVVFVGLAGLVAGFGLARWRGRSEHRGLSALDRRFHDAYDRVRDEASKSVPVLVLFQDTLHLLQGSTQKEFAASDPATSVLMAAAHAPIGIFALLAEHATPEGTRLSDPMRLRLVGLRRDLKQARSSLGQLAPAVRSDVIVVLDACDAYLAEVLSQAFIAQPALVRFARNLGGVLLRLIEEATRLELAALDAATSAALQDLTPEERQQLEVIVAGVHQARARSLPLQYFQQRLGEAPGEEHRLAYAESATDPLRARDLVGTRRLDKVIAGAFFEDPKRLQRDVLGDAAARLLEQRKPDPIG